MQNLRLMVGVIAVAAVTAGAARAQAVGSYAGNQQNGQSINFTVATDTSTGRPEITSIGFGISAPCTNGSTVTSGLGTGASTDIVGNKATITLSDYQFYVLLTVKFGANNTASGALTVIIPSLVSASGAPKRAVVCHTGKQPYSATLGEQAVSAAAPRAFIY